MVVCFSVGELQKLAESLGVGGSIAWERGIQEAAREVVKQCERYAGLDALVSKLREVRPLVEWPEPREPPAASVVATFPAAPPLAPLPTIADPFKPSQSAAAPPVVPPTASPHPPMPWPGNAAEPAAAHGLDPRILIAVGALTVMAALIAYLAGRASNPGGPAPVNSAPASHGPAVLAGAVVLRSLANLARVCELPAGAGTDELVFRRVLERCGPVPPPRAVSSLPSVLPEPTASADEASAPEPTAPRGHGRRPGQGEPQPQSKGCMGGCDAGHRSCKSRCGPEPTEGRAYETYQRCLGRCLSDASRCRLSCRY